MIILGVLTLLMLAGTVFFGKKLYKISENNKAKIVQKEEPTEKEE